MNTELLSVLKEILESQQSSLRDGMSEFDIITLLKNEPYCLLSANALSDSLLLFQTHFVLFHALYQLRNKWRSQAIGELEISATNIQLHAVDHKGDTHSSIDTKDPLADYYLDWQNLANTDEAGVEEMLSNFWLKMAGYDAFQSIDEKAVIAAKTTLELPLNSNISLEQLKQQYRKMQHYHHPDKGGNVEHSQQIVQAYTCLSQYIKVKSSA